MTCKSSRGVLQSMWLVVSAAALLSIVILAALPLNHALSAHPSDVNYTLTPPNVDGVTEVHLSFILLDVPRIDVQSQSFTIEGVLYAGWHDERAAFDTGALITQNESTEEDGLDGKQLAAGQMRAEIDPDFIMQGVKSYSGKAARDVLVAEIWAPQFELVNSRGEIWRNIHTAVRIYQDGFVEYEERFNATLGGKIDLRQFPFDRHVLPIRISTFDYDSRQVTFKQIRTEASPDFRLPGWTVSQITGTSRTDPAYGLSLSNAKSDFLYPMAEIGIRVARNWGDYILRILVPLFLIVAASWSVFWLQKGSISDQMGISFTVLLTVVAFNFLVSEELPPISYMTFLDSVLLLSYVMILLTIVQNLCQAALYNSGKTEASVRIDAVSRWLFPVVHLLAVLGLVLVYFGYPPQII